MVAVKRKFPTLSDGSVDIIAWLNYISIASHLKDLEIIKTSILLTCELTQGLTTFYGQSCLEQSLEIAEIIIDLKLDEEAVAAAILLTTLIHTSTPLDFIHEKINSQVANLLANIKKMEVLDALVPALDKKRTALQIDRLRKAYLAMISDVRVASIKLALQLTIMRGIKNIHPLERKRLGVETLDIYAPLANRLGMGQIKWELEDLAFHYTEPEKYKMIAKFLAERRIDREQRIQKIITHLKNALSETHMRFHLSGRAKHIYSIYLKMKKKFFDYKTIYDASAIRILVPNITDCYKALSIVHSLWEHYPEEFDDYIANPKANGYSSIHTAVKESTDKPIEIQIRTFAMHEEAEHGLAAHWAYKEDNPPPNAYERKIVFLRQLLSWHKHITENTLQEKKLETLFEDRVYVFTPRGEVIDLPQGATPLDFAYHIHTDIGHRCRGAKVNGHIVSLSYKLQTSERVEIITAPNGIPSRDWLNPQAGYIITTRARAKIAQWFKQQELHQYIETAKLTLDKECARAGLTHLDLNKIAWHLHYKNADALLSALGHGRLRTAQIIQTAKSLMQKEEPPYNPLLKSYLASAKKESNNFAIAGINNLLTRIAKCCKPVPGDTIMGYITQGRGVTIHRKYCKNIIHNGSITEQHRILNIDWDTTQFTSYYVDIQVKAQKDESLIKEIAQIISTHKISLITLNYTINKKNNILFLRITVQIQDNKQLQQLIKSIHTLENVYEVKRLIE